MTKTIKANLNSKTSADKYTNRCLFQRYFLLRSLPILSELLMAKWMCFCKKICAYCAHIRESRLELKLKHCRWFHTSCWKMLIFCKRSMAVFFLQDNEKAFTIGLIPDSIWMVIGLCRFASNIRTKICKNGIQPKSNAHSQP